ncbi:TlpA disulfide reductase family protein [Roseateles sp. PN1]|uniref:TlpA disulfide reductase family protein n=1 Tax=Roseateles sp. PN1 TaxID=3137372 RepID=UPI0031399BE0
MNTPRLARLVITMHLAALPLGAMAQLQLGEKAPNELGRAKNGDLVRIPDSPAQVHAVTFWASWCGPCQVELPMLEKLQRVLGPDKLRVIAVNIEDRDVFRKVTRDMADWKMTLSNDPYKTAQKTYKGGPIPHLTIIGRDGMVKKVFIGYSGDELKTVVTAVVDAINE